MNFPDNQRMLAAQLRAGVSMSSNTTGNRLKHSSGDGEHHRLRAKRFFAHGDLRLVVLDLLTKAPSHGYELIKSIEALTKGHYVPSPGVIYPTLDFLQTHNYISLADEENSRREITITPQGIAYLSTEQAQLQTIHERIKARTIGHNLRRYPEMKRALTNIKTVLDLKVNQESLSEEKLRKIIAIIDSAADEISRTK